MTAGSNSNKRTRMSRQDRAKQFMPFAALKGYEEALRKVEEELEKEEEQRTEAELGVEEESRTQLTET